MKQLNHLAIILDGNGRWAANQQKDRSFGHKKGMDKIFDVILWAKKLNISYVTLFCFSTENWSRPKKEVTFLMKIPEKIFNKKQINKYIKEGICIKWLGRRSVVPNHTKKALENIENETKDQTKIIVNIAFDYGSDQELEHAVRQIGSDLLTKKLTLDEMNIETIYNKLYTNLSPKIDFLIRTGGEQRLSNFMLLQLSYAEMYFTKVYWPDFNEKDFGDAINSFYLRDRKFGKIEV